MIKNITCIECPQGCALSVDIESGRVKDVKGAKCPKGKAYAIAEVELPSRILTSTVKASGMDLKYIPVRTDKPIPKADIARAMKVLSDVMVSAPVVPGSVIINDLIGTGAKLISTRRADVV